jgi:hypothetical protein
VVFRTTAPPAPLPTAHHAESCDRDRIEKRPTYDGPAFKLLREGLVQPPQLTNWRFRYLVNFAHCVKLIQDRDLDAALPADPRALVYAVRSSSSFIRCFSARCR